MASLDDEIGGLFDLPPEDFIAARDALAKRLKTAKDAEGAAGVKALRRPTVGAWAVNQLARRHGEDLGALVEAGRDLQRAQRKALSGVRDAGLREATAGRRDVVERLVRLTERVLSEAGRPAATYLDDVRGTLEAASVDEEAAEAVVAGRLSRELPAPSGFGGLEGLRLVPASVPEPRKPRSKKEPKADREAERRARESEAATAECDEAREEARRLSEEALGAEAQADAAESETAAAEEDVERLRRELDEARERERRAGRDLRRLRDGARRARSLADKAAERLRVAEERVRILRAGQPEEADQPG